MFLYIYRNIINQMILTSGSGSFQLDSLRKFVHVRAQLYWQSVLLEPSHAARGSSGNIYRGPIAIVWRLANIPHWHLYIVNK